MGVVPAVKQPHDIRVIEPGHNFGFACEPLLDAPVGCRIAVEQLHRHIPCEAHVHRAPDGGRASSTDLGLQAVPTAEVVTHEASPELR